MEFLVKILLLSSFFFCGTAPGHKQRSRRQSYDKEGSPGLFNCEENENNARNTPMPLDYELAIGPRWTNYSEYTKDPNLPYRYDYTYRMVKITEENGRTTEEPVNSNQFLSRENTTLTLVPYVLTPGMYKIYPTITLKNPADKLRPNTINVCYLYVVGLPPVAVIAGGTYRLVPSNIPLVLNGSESIDMNKPSRDSTTLKYHWSCSQTLRSPNFCTKTPISTFRSFIIPQRFVRANEKFEITLKVTTEHNATTEMRQEIEVTVDAVLLEVRCQKNCPPVAEWSNVNVITFLSVVCLRNCEDVEDEDFTWSISTKSGTGGFTFDYDKDTQFGNKGKKFIINKNVLNPDDYLVTVDLKGQKNKRGQAMTTLIYGKPPTVDSCVVVPAEGVSLKTYFQLDCKQKPSFKRHFYELFSMKQQEDISMAQLIVDDFHPKINTRMFMLPSSEGRVFTVKAAVENGPHVFIQVNAKVTPSLSNKPFDEFTRSFKEIYEGTESISNMISNSNPEQRDVGLQNLQALVDELLDVERTDEDFNEFLEDTKQQIAEDLLKTPLNSLKEVMKVQDIVTKLTAFNQPNKSDPVMAKYSSTLCKKMSQKYVEHLKNEKFLLTKGHISNKVSSGISKCLETNTNPNFDILEPLLINITTDVPVFLESIIKEDYPDYHDFSDGYYKDVENLQESTYNIFEGTAAAAKAMALTAAVGEKPLYQKGKISETVVTKDEAKALTKMEIISNGAVLKPSKDFAKNDHPIDILMTTWTKDILWWNPNNTRVATDIIHVEFWHSACKERVRSFKKPADIFLNIKPEHFQPEIIEDKLEIPKGYSSLMYYELNRHIYVRRVALPPLRNLMVKFHNLSSVALRVAVVEFKFPTIEDFSPGVTIKENETNLVVRKNTRSFDAWFYIGILAEKETLSSESTVDFKVSFATTVCLRWAPVKTQWEVACSPGSENNLTTIHCNCNNFSTIAGHIENIETGRLKVIDPELVLELQRNLVIFIAVVAAFGLYCILLPLMLYKRRKKAILYFLSDNLTPHQYAYLVMVTTGRVGTTSHVAVKIIGKWSSSSAHVLNYPDPKVRLLQKKCKDVFVLTNMKHFGEVRQIQIWVDCHGVKPSWYCEEIEIYDLQWKKSWYFRINRLLSAEKGNIYLTLTPSEPSQKRIVKILKKASIWNGLHTWCFWAHEKKFSFIKRITVVLSTILMIFVIVLMMQGVPQMEMKDSLDLDQFEFGSFEVYTAVISSLVAFIFHISLAWIFRLSTLEFPEIEEESYFSYAVTRTCWIVLIISIVASMTFLFFWGFWVPHNQSLMWLAASGTAIAVDVIIYENICNLIMSYFHKIEMVEYIGQQFDSVIALIERQRALLLQYFGPNILRKQTAHFQKPLKTSQLKEQKMKDQIRQNLGEEFLDLIMFAIYTIILYIVILVNKDSFTVISKNEIQSMFEGKHTRTMAFSSIRTVEEVYQYINQTLIPVIQPIRWYPGLPIAEPGMMVDFTHKYIGVARFRQQRITSDKCRTNKIMDFLNVTKCWPEFRYFRAQTRHFGYGWSNFSSTLILDRLRSVWQYLPASETETIGYVGDIAAYSGGGYVAYLGRNLRNSYVNFRKLMDKLWIDGKTRSFFVEFLTYNGNYNMMTAVRLLFEQSAAGYVANRIEIYSARMIFVHNEMEKVTIIFFILFVAWVILLFIQRSLKVVANFKKFYKNFWLMVDILIITMSFICIITYLIRFKMVGEYLDTLEHIRHNEFIGYFYLFYIEDFLTVCAAFLVLISTARLWKFLRFGVFFKVMETTLSTSSFPLFSVTLAFFVILMAYGSSGLLFFGNEFPELSSFLKIVANLIFISLRPDTVELTQFTKFSVAYWYFGSYMYLMQIILFIYVTIIIMGYVKAQLDFSGEPPPYNLRDFLEEKVKHVSTVLQQRYERMRGGEEKKFVKSKSDEFRYANCMSIPTSVLKAMTCVTKCVIRAVKKNNLEGNLKGSDVQLMLEVCRKIAFPTHEEDDIEIFFKGRFVGERIKVIDEKRIMRVADFVELLLKGKEALTERKEDKEKNLKDQCVKIIKHNQKTLKRCDLILKLVYCNLKDLDFE